MRIICVNTGDKYSQWYTDNLKQMIDTYSKLEYTSFEIIEDIEFGGVYDKLQIFDRFRDGQNLYFDLDILIKGDCNKFITKELTVCHAYWRTEGSYYKINPINSSIISWYGDKSRIYKFFKKDSKEYIKSYNRGIDEWLWQVYRPKTYNDNYYKSIQTEKKELDYPVYLFNQSHDLMNCINWWSKYFLPFE